MNIKDKTIALIDSLKATCQTYGMGNDGNEYKIITQVFLYKFMADKFGYELKKINDPCLKALKKSEKWEEEYAKLTKAEREKVSLFLPPEVPVFKPDYLIANLWNKQAKGDFDVIFDETMVAIAKDNLDVFYYNTAGGGKYAEYYTPKAIAKIMARLLVGDNADLHNVECYDPSAGTGTLLMALSHQIGEDRCTIFAQDISQRSNKMLKLNLLLNGLVSSLDHAVQGDTLLEPYHKSDDGKSLKQFDYVVSNPPFKTDFSDTRDRIEDKWGTGDGHRFWAGVPKVPNKKKESMAIYTCFIQHVVNSIKAGGKGAIVIPTGFITAKSGIEYKILKRIVDEHIVYGVVSMPSNVFANTGTNVSVLFFDKSKKKTDKDKVTLVDASKLGQEYKDANGLKKVRLEDDEIEKIVTTFRKAKAIEDFSVVVSYSEVKEKGYSLSAGQYFDIKIDYVDITADEFNAQMKADTEELAAMFAESHKLEKEIQKQLEGLQFVK